MKTKFILLLTAFIIFSCKKEPEYKPMPSNGVSTDTHEHAVPSDTDETLSNEVHKVLVKEIIPASRYLYLNVEENGALFWIAVVKQDVEVGKTYYYNRALLKTDFESKETNKFFDKIYLVTNLVGEDHAHNPGMTLPGGQGTMTETNKQATNSPADKAELNEKKGSLKIADLVSDPKKYEGKTVQISGKCFKINPNIMDRNWIHLRDGSKDDYDLVITSTEFVPEGTVVTMKGVVTLNKDFGAGYSYDLILENGSLIK